MPNDDAVKMQRLAQVAEVFTPGAPIDSYALFAGRLEQVMDVINAVYQKGQHVILYGERGVGKTSLANILSDVFSDRDRAVPLQSVRTNCGTNDDFTSIWDRLFKKLGLDQADDQPYLGRKLAPEDVRERLESLTSRTLIVIDELDRLEDDDSLTLLADTIKALSDHAVLATVMLVGVADSVDELVGDHQSIERAMVQIEMPRMDDEELGEIIDKGMARLGMSIHPEARRTIARLSEGLPFYTHALGRYATQNAIADDRDQVSAGDIQYAISQTVRKAQHSIRSSYERATQSARKDNLFAEVLLACALAPKTSLGFFSASGVREPLSRLMGKPYEIPAFARHLNEFIDIVRGPILEKRGTKHRYFYRFANPLLQPFVILQGLTTGRISDELLRELQDEASSGVAASPNEVLRPS